MELNVKSIAKQLVVVVICLVVIHFATQYIPGGSTVRSFTGTN